MVPAWLVVPLLETLLGAKYIGRRDDPKGCRSERLTLLDSTTLLDILHCRLHNAEPSTIPYQLV